MQKIADKNFGASYLTILGSLRNFWMISIGNLSMKCISGIGYEASFVLFSVVNVFNVIFFRKNYIDFLDSKKPEEFAVELKLRSEKKKEE